MALGTKYTPGALGSLQDTMMKIAELRRLQAQLKNQPTRKTRPSGIGVGMGGPDAPGGLGSSLGNTLGRIVQASQQAPGVRGAGNMAAPTMGGGTASGPGGPPPRPGMAGARPMGDANPGAGPMPGGTQPPPWMLPLMMAQDRGNAIRQGQGPGGSRDIRAGLPPIDPSWMKKPWVGNWPESMPKGTPFPDPMTPGGALDPAKERALRMDPHPGLDFERGQRGIPQPEGAFPVQNQARTIGDWGNIQGRPEPKFTEDQINMAFPQGVDGPVRNAVEIIPTNQAEIDSWDKVQLRSSGPPTAPQPGPPPAADPAAQQALEAAQWFGPGGQAGFEARNLPPEMQAAPPPAPMPGPMDGAMMGPMMGGMPVGMPMDPMMGMGMPMGPMMGGMGMPFDPMMFGGMF